MYKAVYSFTRYWQVGPGFRSTLRLLRCSRLDPQAAFARPAARNATRWLQVRRCCGVFVPTVQLALFRYRSDSEENCPGVLTLGPG
jgi:hypothetical protein